jgi:hypothetical protein
LDQDHLRSTTTSRADPSFTKDRLWLNGKEEEIKPNSRTATCIVEMKRLRADLEAKNPTELKVRMGKSSRLLFHFLIRPLSSPNFVSTLRQRTISRLLLDWPLRHPVLQLW